MKKAQITIFIIMGLIVLFTMLVFFALVKPKFGRIGYDDPRIIKPFISSCIEDTSRYALFELGLQGGYNYLPANYFEGSYLNVAYAYNDGNVLVSIPEIENQLSIFVNKNLMRCVENGIYVYRKRFDDVELGVPKTKVYIQKDDVRFEVDFPVTVKQGDSITRLKEPYTDIILPVRLRYIHSIVERIANNIAETGYMLNLDCIDDEGIIIKGNSYGNKDLFYIEDRQSLLLNSPDRTNKYYRFFFAVSS